MQNPLVEFLYKYAVQIRSGQAEKQIHMYAVSRQLIKTVLEVCEKVSVEKLQFCVESAMKSITSASKAEQSILFELLDAGLTSITINQEVVYIDKAWKNKNTHKDNEPVQV